MRSHSPSSVTTTGWLISVLLWCTIGINTVLCASDSKSESLPDPLTIENFDSTIKKDLHFIEFFSPYCAHCKHLAPTWESTYHRFKPKQDSLKIYMHQVNCVESGDLCSRENIKYYPALRLYSGDGETGVFKKSYPTKAKRTEESFINYLTEQSSKVAGIDQDIPHQSSQLSTTDLLKLLNGELSEPVLVSFWPTTDEELNIANFDTALKENKEFNSHLLEICPECFDLKNSWGHITSKIPMKSAFFNCRSNPEICNNLELNSLSDKSDNMIRRPSLKAFLPREAGNKIDYNFDITDSSDNVIKWCEKLIENYQVSLTDLKLLSEKMDLKHSLRRDSSSDLNAENHVNFVFYYDQASGVAEDFDILPHLIQDIMDIPFQVSIYRSSDKKFEQFMLKQHKGLLNYIEYENNFAISKIGLSVEEDEEMYHFNSITALPTLFCFKDNSLLNAKYINFNSNDLRDYLKVSRFITKNSIPFQQELTRSNYNQFFPVKFDRKIYTKQDKVVVTFVDTKNFPNYADAMLKLSLTEHELAYYNDFKKFDRVKQKRQDKVNKVNELRLSQTSGSTTTTSKKTADEIMAIMRTKINHEEQSSTTVFTYIDLSNEENMQLPLWKGWNLDQRNYNNGDVVIVSRFADSYWDLAESSGSGSGEASTESPLQVPKLTEILVDLNYNQGKTKSLKLRARLIDSPWGKSMRFMDSIHRHGIMGYVSLIGLLFVVIHLGRRCLKRRNRLKSMEQRNKGLGLLGRSPQVFEKNE